MFYENINLIQRTHFTFFIQIYDALKSIRFETSNYNKVSVTCISLFYWYATAVFIPIWDDPGSFSRIAPNDL